MGYLDEYTRRRVAAVLLVLGLLVAAAAIADFGPFDDPPTDAELAEAATREFFAAGSSEDYEAACALMTKETRAQFARLYAALGAEEDAEGCPAILEAAARDELADPSLEVLEVSISGPQARVEIRRRLEGEGRLQQTVLLQEVAGSWKISDPGLS